jgi:hypothetical protein
MEVSRDTFKQSDRDTQNLILFDSIFEIHKKLDTFGGECTLKHTDIEKKIAKSGRINKIITGGGGFLGGITAYFGSKFFGM